MQFVKAVGMGSQTLVGVYVNEYPIEHGNCFSLIVENQKLEVKILNFVCENFEYLISEEVLTYPVEVIQLTERYGLLCDSRIPHRKWYKKSMCSTCAPKYLLTVPQLVNEISDIKSRRMQVFENYYRYIIGGGGVDPNLPLTTFEEKHITYLLKLIEQKTRNIEDGE